MIRSHRDRTRGIAIAVRDLAAGQVWRHADPARTTIAVILRGRGSVASGPLAGVTPTGHLLVAPAGVSLVLRAQRASTIAILGYEDSALAQLGQGRAALAHPHRFSGRSSVELAWRLRAELGHQDDLSDAARWFLAIGVAIGVARGASRLPTAVPAGMLRARDRLRARSEDPPSPATLATELGWSREHFSRTFRRTFGCTTTEFIRRVRVERARHLLAGTSASLSAIAHQLGFADQSHFTRTFHRATGLAPGEFRVLQAEITPVQ